MSLLVAGLLSFVGAWMLVDGGRALIVGDYFTPRDGAHAGRLGPWSRIVEWAGIQPRSKMMKLIFVVIGAVHLVGAVSVAVAPETSWVWIAVAASVAGLWYLPFGTLLDLVALALIALGDVRPWT